MTSGQGREPTCVITYDVIRNLTSSPEKENGVQTWFANVPASQIVKIGTTDNLRAYIAEHSPAKRNGVHKQIAATIEGAADRFINRNSGITITCTNAVVDDAAKTIKLRDASIINGAQTQGEIRRYFELNEGEAETGRESGREQQTHCKEQQRTIASGDAPISHAHRLQVHRRSPTRQSPR